MRSIRGNRPTDYEKPRLTSQRGRTRKNGEKTSLKAHSRLSSRRLKGKPISHRAFVLYENSAGLIVRVTRSRVLICLRPYLSFASLDIRQSHCLPIVRALGSFPSFMPGENYVRSAAGEKGIAFSIATLTVGSVERSGKLTEEGFFLGCVNCE